MPLLSHQILGTHLKILLAETRPKPGGVKMELGQRKELKFILVIKRTFRINGLNAQ